MAWGIRIMIVAMICPVESISDLGQMPWDDVIVCLAVQLSTFPTIGRLCGLFPRLSRKILQQQREVSRLLEFSLMLKYFPGEHSEQPKYIVLSYVPLDPENWGIATPQPEVTTQFFAK